MGIEEILKTRVRKSEKKTEMISEKKGEKHESQVKIRVDNKLQRKQGIGDEQYKNSSEFELKVLVLMENWTG